MEEWIQNFEMMSDKFQSNSTISRQTCKPIPPQKFKYQTTIEICIFNEETVTIEAFAYSALDADELAFSKYLNHITDLIDDAGVRNRNKIWKIIASIIQN